jgi:[acyl-carrier-protein] S-malonyltransferase
MTTNPSMTAPASSNSPESPNLTAKVTEVVLCPGQGAQHVGMGKAWHDQSAAARETFAEADETLGFELSRVCFEGPEETLHRTDVAQAAIYTTSVACFRGLAQLAPLGKLGAVAGLSLGEFTALHLAGAFDFVTGLQLVRLRGQAMQQAADDSHGSGMVALTGADPQQAQELCDKAVRAAGADTAHPPQVLVPANYNCPGQIVVSGSRAACEAAVTIAQEMDLRATALKVAGAFHSPLMAPAAKQLAQALDSTQWQTPSVPVLSNVTAQPHDPNDTESIKARLVEQLTSPVRWTQSMQWLAQHVPGRYVELAPGKVLSGLMRRIDRSVKVLNLAQPAA